MMSRVGRTSRLGGFVQKVPTTFGKQPYTLELLVKLDVRSVLAVALASFPEGRLPTAFLELLVSGTLTRTVLSHRI